MLTALEQYFVELVNRARADPAAEARRLQVPLNEGLAPGTISAAAKEPLAIVNALARAADSHSADMVARNFFDHVNPDGDTPYDRATDAGWRASRGFVGENIAGLFTFRNTVATIAVIDDHHLGLFESESHRENTFEPEYSEIGIGQAFGPYRLDGTRYPESSLVTQNFADGGRTYITGVVIDDKDGDAFYDVGEGLGNVSVSVTSASAGLGSSVSVSYSGATYAAGGYAVEVPRAGTYEVIFSGGALDGEVRATVRVAGQNVKVDAFADDAIAIGGPDEANEGGASGSPIFASPVRPARTPDAPDGSGLIVGTARADRLTGSQGSDSLVGGSGHDQLTGSGGADTLQGGVGNDTLWGGPGADRISAGAGRDVADGGPGADRIVGGNGADSLLGGAGPDLIHGGVNQDTLYGEAGRDTLSGHYGDDAIIGGTGNDVLRGGPGADVLFGGAGDDRANGGPGRDTYVYEEGSDRVVFQDGADRIDLTALELDGFAADIAPIIQSGARYAILDFGDRGAIWVLGTPGDALDASDFIF